MRLERVQLKRWPGWPWWAVLLPVLWLALGAANLLLRAALDRPVQLCLLKHFTGWPCPTCGFTRGTLAFLQGRPIQGWLYNPLLFSALGLAGGAVTVRLLFGRGLHVHMTRGERAVAWFLALAFFGANWLYVIRYVG